MMSPPAFGRSLALALLFAGAFRAQAQPEPIKFGKPDPRDFTPEAFVGDSAAAVVLSDFATVKVETGANNSLQTLLERTTRVKILKKAGYTWATVEIPLVGLGQKLVGLKGFTYNLVNGMVEKVPLEDDGEFVDELTRHIRIRKFTMPKVCEGSVIEFTYAVTSYGAHLPGWQFQRSIPVRWSEFRVNYPDYFSYKTVMQGYLPLAVREQTQGSTLMGSKAVTTSQFRWAMKDVPALRTEPYITTMDDYVARLDLELAGIYVPGRANQDFGGSWEAIDASLLRSETFGQLLDQGGFLKARLARQALAPSGLLTDRVAAVHTLVREAVKYNDYATIVPSGPLRRTFEELHRGNAADINLLLIAALRAAGIEANPVLLSTRDNGRLNVNFPMASRFNYVVAHVGLAGGQDLLLDATEPLLPAGMLPERCLNQLGRLVMKDSKDSRWLDLTPSQRRVHFQQATLALSPQGGLGGKVHEEYSGYAGAAVRTELEKLGEPKYRNQFAGRHAAWTISGFAISGLTAPARPVALDYEFTQPADTPGPTGTRYLNPLSELMAEQNPFSNEKRTFPVDFGMMQDETLLLAVSLPAGYEVSELPKAAVVDLPDNGGRFFYGIAVADTGVSITSRLTLRKPVYSADEYQHLRELYRLMLAKQAEKLVIKKKA